MKGNAERWRVRFYGKVQFVGFRHTAMLLARQLGLSGWVRNMPDGSVLLEAQGQTSVLRQMLIRLKCRPPIHIEKAVIRVIPPEPGERSFRIG